MTQLRVSSAPAMFATRSANRKLSVNKEVNTTWVSQHSCPSECPFRGSGCYAESGPAGFITGRLNRNTEVDPYEIALVEADLIRNSEAQYNLRLHSVGDCSTNDAAKVVSDACSEYMKKNGKRVWTYTHASNVDRSSWGEVSVLKSCESMDHVKSAFSRGYAAAMVVSAFKKDTAYDLGDGFTGIPCPQQTGKAPDCNSCKLCMNDKALYKGRRVILFHVHGTGAKKASKALSL